MSKRSEYMKRLSYADVLAARVKGTDAHGEAGLGDLRMVVTVSLVETVASMTKEDIIDAVEQRVVDFDWLDDASRPGQYREE